MVDGDVGIVGVSRNACDCYRQCPINKADNTANSYGIARIVGDAVGQHAVVVRIARDDLAFKGCYVLIRPGAASLGGGVFIGSSALVVSFWP